MQSTEDKSDFVIDLFEAIINANPDVLNINSDFMNGVFKAHGVKYEHEKFKAFGDILASIRMFFQWSPFDDEKIQRLAQTRVTEWSHVILDQLIDAKIIAADDE